MVRYSPAIVISATRRPFDFSGNHVALDFTNTVSGRPTYSRDDLADADDVIAWARAAGILNHADAVAGGPGAAAGLHAAIALRENLYSVFGAIAQLDEPPQAALDFVSRRAAQALRSSTWELAEGGYRPGWPFDSIESICHRLADEAVQLLRSPATSRIGSCAGCGWLFLDLSRAHARRWCSMNACGVRSKMRRYHQRQASASATAVG